MVTVRFARRGSRSKPYYHLVVTDKENPRDGKFIEQIGTYDPRKPMKDATVDLARLDYWLGVGAKPSESAAKVLREYRKAAQA